ncbi:AraC family transcriptional regulator [Nocardioides sp. zg-1228]|uniref:helix-turn-helix domain-containing protein n=1 Tax=Nocardioides sp. zg-1228 TaxID=2763008 RepID=UPI001642D67E|nr:AraC family transcriptional regulator [Nocardioides sp. zg-1228]MBC2933611.1 helix-turn-helix transcriptional regulator [Nocardioides sp. zg-1228]QSF56262.1 helix-turn-helix transcriptional regulator [Nocardioides sp. zg-1228]
MGGGWEQVPEARVPAPLAPHVTSMYGYAASGLAPGVHRGLPSAELTMVLSLDEPLRTAPTAEDWGAGVRDAQWVSLGGLHTRPAMVEQPGRWAGVQLTLDPVGVRRLLGVPAAELPVGSWDARDLFGAEVDRVVEEMHAAPDWNGRYAAVAGFLSRRIRRTQRGAEPRDASAEVREAWRLLTRRRHLAVSDVADAVGYSRRRLHQLITAETGHGPKTVQRLARFDVARRAVVAAGASGSSLAQVAARTGYYDQSHLVRDFREFAGLGPSAWLTAEFPNIQGAPPGVAAASSP